MLVFGIQQFHYVGFVKGLEIVPEWIPAHAFWAYLAGAVLVAAGLCVLFKKSVNIGASLLGGLFLLCLLFLHGPRLPAILHDGTERSRAFETLAMCGSALLLAGPRPVGPGRLFLAVSMLVFGLDHFLFAGFVATLIPGWIPGHLFWAWFTGFCFVAAGLAFALKKLAPLAALLLGLMFLLWFVVLHVPRVIASPRNGDEWNSAFVALGLSGAAFVAAYILRNGSNTSEVKAI